MQKSIGHIWWRCFDSKIRQDWRKSYRTKMFHGQWGNATPLEKPQRLFMAFSLLPSSNCEFSCFFEILLMTASSLFSCLPSAHFSKRSSACLTLQTLKRIAQQGGNPCRSPGLSLSNTFVPALKYFMLHVIL